LVVLYAHRWDVPDIYFINVFCDSTELLYKRGHHVVFITWSLSNTGTGIFKHSKVRENVDSCYVIEPKELPCRRHYNVWKYLFKVWPPEGLT
jgi:hypothetical protein